MNPWSTYCSRIEAKGGTRREAEFRREARNLSRKMPGSLAYQSMEIDGVMRNVAVINSDNLNIKTLCSMPGEDLRHGSTVSWMDNHWLITGRDAFNELYTKVTMQQCNYLLKWVSKDGEVIKRWSIVEDGTKYLTGEYGDNEFIMIRGDSRLTLILPRDKETLRLNRDNRFLIDDEGSPNVLAYRLTKPFKLGGSFTGNGVLSFVLTECNTEDTDNLELHIANYYDYFPKPAKPEVEPPILEGHTPQEKPGDSAAKKVWL